MIPFDTTQITSAGNYSQPKAGDPCHPLASGAHAPAIAATIKQRGRGATDEVMDNLIAHTLKAEGHDASEDGTGRGVPMVLAQNGSDVQVGHTPGALGAGHARQTSGDLIAFDPTAGRDMRAYGDGTTPGLKVGTGIQVDVGWAPAIQSANLVRRLTPTECERLQAFPDGWTCTCGVEPYSTMTCRCPDSPRYRALGNAVTTTVIEWIGRRLMAFMDSQP